MSAKKICYQNYSTIFNGLIGKFVIQRYDKIYLWNAQRFSEKIQQGFIVKNLPNLFWVKIREKARAQSRFILLLGKFVDNFATILFYLHIFREKLFNK
jgi:hypothetical protein